MLLGFAKRAVHAFRRVSSYVLRMIGFSDVGTLDHSWDAAVGDGRGVIASPFALTRSARGKSLPVPAPRVLMLGLRGLPHVQGGVEKHVEQLALQLLKANWTVEVIARAPYVKQNKSYVWSGIRVIPLWSPTYTKLEAIVHTFTGVLYAAWSRPDILHIHAIGPSLLVPLARLLGLTVVVTHHGFDYDREKWGFIAKTALRLGEYFGMRFANARIAVAKNIAEAMEKRYSVPVKFIPNGVSVDTNTVDTDVLGHFDLAPNRYIVIVSRIVQEKRQLDLIEAFEKLAPSDMKLVIVGKGDEGSHYAGRVFAAATRVTNVVCTGQQTGANLATLYRNAALFVLPSSHEGMPIAVLEAMAYRVPVVVSDIPANLALGLRSDAYFPLGDIDALAAAMKAKLDRKRIGEDGGSEAAIEALYSWSSSCDQTLDTYRTVLDDGTDGRIKPVHPALSGVTLTEKTP